MKSLRPLIVVSAFVASGCNLYSELDRPEGDLDAGNLTTNNIANDGGIEEDLSFTDADFMGDERWRAIDVEIGPTATQPTAWRITVPDGIATANFGPGGTWLRVYDEEGNPVPRQIESWTTGAHIFWVNVDPGPADTRRFWIRYGLEPEDGGPDDGDVWSAGAYDMVWGFASDPGSEIPAWAGTKAAMPIEGNGTIAIGGGRTAICVTGLDGWATGADASLGIGRTSNGRTYEVVYRGDPGGTAGHVLSTEDLCNGIGLILSDNSIIGRLHAGTSCADGFDSGQVVATRPASDTTAFTHAMLTVEPVMQGYNLALYVNGSSVATGRVNTQNDIAGNELEIGAYLGNEEHAVCVDQVHVASGVRAAADVEAAFRGSVGEGVGIGGERPMPDFQSL